MFNRIMQASRLGNVYGFMRILGIFAVLLLLGNYHAQAEVSLKNVAEVRTIYPSEWGVGHPAGLAYATNFNRFFLIEKGTDIQPTVVVLSPYEDLIARTQLKTTIADAINLTFDDTANRLFLLNAELTRLVQVNVGSSGRLDAASETQTDITALGLQDAQGMAVDAKGKFLFILDNVAAQIVRVKLTDNMAQPEFDKFNLTFSSDIGNLRGLAVNPSNRHLYALHPTQQRLYDLTQTGELVTQYDLAGLQLTAARAMVYAPSPDLTDSTKIAHLFIADSQVLASQAAVVQASELSLLNKLYLSWIAAAGSAGVDANQSGTVTSAAQSAVYGKIVEVELDVAGAMVGAASVNTTLTLVRTTLTSVYSPPSPDPSGLAYLPATGTLLIADGEVDEMPPYFVGKSLFRSTLPGALVETYSTSFTDEPAGADVNPVNNHLFLSDDTGTRTVYELNPGTDGLYNTSGDSVTSFKTGVFNSTDPEGLAYDPSGSGTLYVVDGVNREVYRVDPGANGLFDGIPPTGDDIVTHFDTQVFGLNDPEGGAFNPVNGHLYLVGKPPTTLFEVTTAGVLVQTLDISAANARKPAGLAYGPGSQDPTQASIYVVDRGTDNDSNPNENDGKLYELALGQPFGTNNPPVATDDSASPNEDTAVSIDVAANDTDVDNNLNPASATTGCATGCATPTHGTLVNQNNGSFTYTPNQNFNGADSFVYQICDTQNACDTASVAITVNAVNDPPVATDDSASTNAGTGVSINVAANDSDVDTNLDPASANTTCGSCTTPADGALVNQGNGSFTYTPNANFTGADSFVYEICDTQNACDTASVAITVNVLNDPPVANDDSASTNEDTGVSIDVAANDTDVDNNLNPASATTGCVTGCTTPTHGTLVNQNNGSFTYTPNQNFNGADSFVYQICDTQNACDTASVAITVDAVNDPPVATDDSASTNAGTGVSIAVATNDTDVDTNLDPASANTTCGSCTTPADGALVNQGNGSFTYTPNANFTGADSFVYEICDTQNACDTASVAITVNVLNDPPVANDDSASTNEDTGVSIDVAANDTDVDNNLNPASATTGCVTGCTTPTHGTLVNQNNGSFTYTPNQNFNGADSFVYQICDTQNACDTASVAITVNAVNDPPVATDDSASTNAGTGVSINVATNDSDVDTNLDPASANTTCGSCTTPADGALVNQGNGSFIYTPNANFTGADSFVYEICDTQNACDTASVAITVNAVTTGFYLSLSGSGTAGTVAAKDEDILRFNGTSFAMVFDGSAVGVGGVDVDAFYFVDADTILMSFDNPVTLGALGTVADSDIVQFDATALGLNTTAGSFSMYFDGSDVGLDTSSEDIDALDLLGDGRLLISTSSSIAVPGVSGADEDLLAFTPTTLGANTSGIWAIYFDGSDVGVDLATSDEDIDGVSVVSGKIYLTTVGNFAVTGVSGADEDIFICTPTSLGPVTACNYAPTLFFDGSVWGLSANDLDAIDLDKGGQPAAAAALVTLQAVEHPGVADDPGPAPDAEPEDVDEPDQEPKIFLPLVSVKE